MSETEPKPKTSMFQSFKSKMTNIMNRKPKTEDPAPSEELEPETGPEGELEPETGPEGELEPETESDETDGDFNNMDGVTGTSTDDPNNMDGVTGSKPSMFDSIKTGIGNIKKGINEAKSEMSSTTTLSTDSLGEVIIKFVIDPQFENVNMAEIIPALAVINEAKKIMNTMNDIGKSFSEKLKKGKNKNDKDKKADSEETDDDKDKEPSTEDNKMEGGGPIYIFTSQECDFFV
jgi:hypothetical protein